MERVGKKNEKILLNIIIKDGKPSFTTRIKALFVRPLIYMLLTKKTCHSSISPIRQRWLIGQENLRP